MRTFLIVLPPCVVYCGSVKNFFSVSSCGCANAAGTKSASTSARRGPKRMRMSFSLWMYGAADGAMRTRERQWRLGALRRLDGCGARPRRDKAGEEESRLVEQAHRHREHELRQHVGRRHDGGDDESADDHIRPRILQLLDAHHAHAHEHDHGNRDFEGAAERKEQ